MKEQKYYCEKCKVGGYIVHGDHADVLTVVYMIEADHKERSPECTQPVTKLKAVI